MCGSNVIQMCGSKLSMKLLNTLLKHGHFESSIKGTTVYCNTCSEEFGCVFTPLSG